MITEALPMTMPTIVSRLRNRLLFNVVSAILTVSPVEILSFMDAEGSDQCVWCFGADDSNLHQIRRP